MEDKKWDLAALASIPLIMTLGNSMLIPILPQISQQLHVGPFQVSMLITVYAVVAILLIPIAGYLSDRYGRKTVIIPSLIIAAVGGALSGAAAWMTEGLAAYWIILGGRFLQGIGAAGAFPIVLPLVGDMFKEEDDVSKSLGIIETSNTFGKVLSPILGAALASVIWYLPFLSIPVLCVISLLMVLFFVKPPKKKDDQDHSIGSFLRDTKDILREKGRWLYAIFAVGGISMFILFGVLFYLSETLESKYGLGGVIKGLVLAIPLAVLCLASFVAKQSHREKQEADEMDGILRHGRTDRMPGHYRLQRPNHFRRRVFFVMRSRNRHGPAVHGCADHRRHRREAARNHHFPLQQHAFHRGVLGPAYRFPSHEN